MTKEERRRRDTVVMWHYEGATIQSRLWDETDYPNAWTLDRDPQWLWSTHDYRRAPDQ